MELLHHTLNVTLATIRDVFPIVAIIFGFQWLVIRRPIHNLKRVVIVVFGWARRSAVPSGRGYGETID